MSLETFTGKIADLVPTNPSGADPKSQGDDHIRGIKLAVNGDAVDKSTAQTIAGVKTFSSNPLSSSAQNTGVTALTRKDYVDSAISTAIAAIPPHSGSITTSGFTMTTDKLLGRDTNATGAIEEITVGSGLTLSGGVLAAIADPPSITSGSPVIATGASVDFTSIPSWVKRITVMLTSTTANGASQWLLQLGDSGGIETTGYQGNVMNFASTFQHNIGFEITGTTTTATIWNSVIILSLINAATNTWVANICCAGVTLNYYSIGAGSKSLSSVLDRIRLTSTNGTQTFTAGTMNILYE